MEVVVQKYGGSSVADVERIRKVAARVKARRERGEALVVVVSAMGDTTDELLTLARRVSADPPRRELDMLLSCGERISMALLSMALQEIEVPAVSFTGSQSGIITDEAHARARIVEVRPDRIRQALEAGKVAIVAGYQGVSRAREVTTLGRGGSDTTAVALAAALGARACEIYSDVDGVFSADPRVVVDARKLESLTYEEMQTLAIAGAQVLNAQAVEFARAAGIEIRALSAHGAGTGTTIGAQGGSAAVSAVTSDKAIAAVTWSGALPPELLPWIHARGGRLRTFDGGGAAGGRLLFSLTDVHQSGDLGGALPPPIRERVSLRTDLGTATLVGPGVLRSTEHVERALRCVAAIEVACQAIHAGPLELSLLVLASALPRVVPALHAEFVL